MKQQSKVLLSSSSGLLLLIVAIFAINIISSKLYFRLDVTQDRIFTLSQGTRSILRELPRDVDVRLYFSRSISEIPVPLKTYATRVEEVLSEYASLSRGRLAVEVIDARPDTDDEEWARKYGLRGARMPNGLEMFFGLVFIAGGEELVIPYLDPRREEFLEYDLSEALVRLTSERQLKISLYSSLPVASQGMSPMMPEQGQGDWVFVQQLRRNYDLHMLGPDATNIEPDTDIVILFHPKNLSEPLEYAVDQFVLRGGRVITMVDPFSRHELSLIGQQAMMAGQMPNTSSNLSRLFRAWDIEFNATEMVGDRQHSMQVNVGGAVMPYPYFLDLQSRQMSTDSVITSRLNQVLVAEGGQIKLSPDSPYRFEPLLKTGEQSGTSTASLAAFMDPADLARELKVTSESHVISALVSGRFRSAFSDGPPEGVNDGLASQHVLEAEREGVILVVADTDMFADENSVDKMRFGPQVILRPRNDNLNFLFNAIEFLGGSEDLIAIRSRGRIARPFTKVQEIQATAQQRWQQEEERLSQQIADLQRRLSELQAERASGNHFTLSQQQQDEIDRFRQQEAEARRRRREVRKNLREDIERLGTRIIAANMLVVPLGVGIFGLGVFIRRARRTRRKQ